MENILIQIEKAISGKNRSFQLIAKYILEHRDDVIFMTLDTLSRNVGVSTTTVVRFVRLVNNSGYKEFQSQLRSELMSKNKAFTAYGKLSKIQTTNDMNSILKNTLQCSLNNINETFKNIEENTFEAAVNLFFSAKRNIYIAGFGSSHALAYLAYTRLLPLKDNIYLYDQDLAECVDPILSMKEDDICFYFIFHYYNQRSQLILKELFKRGVKIILITDYPCDSVDLYGTVVLPCFVNSISPKNSLVAPVAIIDYLCAAIAIRDRDKALAKFSESSELHSKLSVTAR